MTTFDLAFLEAAVNADGRSLNAIGKAARLPRGALSRILNRRIKRPDLDHLRGLAEALGHGLDQLLGEAGGAAQALVEPDPETRAGWAVFINASWRASVESIIETGRRLIAAKDALAFGAFGPMVDGDLAFGARTAQMLMRIAQDGRITDAKHASLLPPSWSTLHELTRIEGDDAFAAAVESGAIRPDMERKHAAALRGGPAGDDGAQTDIEDVLEPAERGTSDHAIDHAEEGMASHEQSDLIEADKENGPKGTLARTKLQMPEREDVWIETRHASPGQPWHAFYQSPWGSGETPMTWHTAAAALGAAASLLASDMREISLKPDNRPGTRALAREIMDWANDQGAGFGAARVDMPGETPPPDPGGDDLSAASPEAPPVRLPKPKKPGDGWRDKDDPDTAGKHARGLIGRFPYQWTSAASRGTSGSWPMELKFWDPATATRQRYIRADLAKGEWWNHDTGMPGMALFCNALSVWVIAQDRDVTVGDAALAFNVAPALIRQAVEWHYWMLLGAGDVIEHDGE